MFQYGTDIGIVIMLVLSNFLIKFDALITDLGEVVFSTSSHRRQCIVLIDL
jgi:hypothetical protein